jgi:hypothetical protein
VWLDELLQIADACSSSSSSNSSSSPLIVGIDTETAVIWGQKQRNTPTSLLQLCYHAPGSAKVCWGLFSRQCSSSSQFTCCNSNQSAMQEGSQHSGASDSLAQHAIQMLQQTQHHCDSRSTISICAKQHIQRKHCIAACLFSCVILCCCSACTLRPTSA